MPKKTLFLIVGLVIVTVILFIIAIQNGKQQSQQPSKEQTSANVTPVPDVAHTVLSMSPNPVEVVSGRAGSVDVMIDPSDNNVTAIQLELLYDPTVMSNVEVTPGPLFTNAAVLLDDNDATTGRYTYAYGIQPGQEPVIKQGIAATITFTARGTVGKQTQIIVRENSLVTSRGVATSVLKEGRGTTIVIAPASAAAPGVQTVSPVPAAASPTPAVIQ